MAKKSRGITLKIGAREFEIEDLPIEQEEIYRVAAKEINKSIAVYQSSLQGEPDEFIYLAALHIAVQKVKSERNQQIQNQAEMLEQIDKKLTEYITSAKIK